MGHSNHENHHHDQPHTRRKKGLHKDWRTWVVVLLMLAAMAIYVLSFDERFQFGSAKPAKPAAPASSNGN
jgi:hypothetical protein